MFGRELIEYFWCFALAYAILKADYAKQFTDFPHGRLRLLAISRILLIQITRRFLPSSVDLGDARTFLSVRLAGPVGLGQIGTDELVLTRP